MVSPDLRVSPDALTTLAEGITRAVVAFESAVANDQVDVPQGQFLCGGTSISQASDLAALLPKCVNNVNSTLHDVIASLKTTANLIQNAAGHYSSRDGRVASSIADTGPSS